MANMKHRDFLDACERLAAGKIKPGDELTELFTYAQSAAWERQRFTECLLEAYTRKCIDVQVARQLLDEFKRKRGEA